MAHRSKWRGRRQVQLGDTRSRRAGGYRSFVKQQTSRLMRRLAKNDPEDAPREQRALTRGYD